MLELLGSEQVGHHDASLDLYRRLPADPVLRAELVGITERFHTLAGLQEDDPSVDMPLADAAGAGDAVAALVPEALRRAPGNPGGADLLLKAMTTSTSPSPTFLPASPAGPLAATTGSSWRASPTTEASGSSFGLLEPPIRKL